MSSIFDFNGMSGRGKLFAQNAQNEHGAFVQAWVRAKRKKNYVGRVTLPTSIKEKETHWLIKSREPPPPREKKDRQNYCGPGGLLEAPGSRTKRLRSTDTQENWVNNFSLSANKITK
eukprot:1149086-Pelagomonas_calceolata.AAC.1